MQYAALVTFQYAISICFMEIRKVIFNFLFAVKSQSCNQIFSGELVVKLLKDTYGFKESDNIVCKKKENDLYYNLLSV